MKKGIYIGIVAVFTACATYQQPLADDAYYWPDTEQEVQIVRSTQSTQSTPIVSDTPTMEILNRQDTTITVRIKR